MKAGKIIASAGKSVEYKGIAGMFSCTLQHKVTETSADLDWSGAKITPETWQEILAFFQWTQREHKSEAMVDLFYHPANGWKAWAFSQKGGTGMTINAANLETDKVQRIAIGDGFMHFGTVHHHCDSSAFQSGTDTHDERNLSGLHITVGDLNKEKFSLHARIYMKENKFEPDMSAFWDIGEDASSRAIELSELGFNITEIVDRIARSQMCVPVKVDHPFNEEWKKNYIVPLPVPATPTTYGSKYEWQVGPGKGMGLAGIVQTPTTVIGGAGGGKRRGRHNQNGLQKLDALETLGEIAKIARHMYCEDKDLIRIIEFLGDDQEFRMIQRIHEVCAENNVLLADLWDQLHARILSKEIEESKGLTEGTGHSEHNGLGMHPGYMGMHD